MTRKRQNLFKTALVSLGLLCSSVGLAQMVSFKLENAGTTLQPDQVRGFNFGNFMNVVEFLKDFQDLQPTVIRFPGGNIGDERNFLEPDFAGLKNNWLLLQKPKVVIQTRVFARTDEKGALNSPEDAANMVRALKAAEIPVWYWEIGNEPDLYSVNRGDPSWTPEKYCDTFRAQREAMLKVDPTIKLVGPSISGAGNRFFVEGFVKKCGDIVDVLSWHQYPTDGTATDEAALASVQGVSDDLEFYKNLWKDPVRNPLGYQRKIELGMTELGLSWRSPSYRHLTDQVAALWATETILRLAEGGMSLINYFSLQGTQGHGLIGDDYTYRPTFYAFNFLKDFYGNSLKVTSGNPALWSHAVERDGKLQLLVMNTSTSPLSANTDLAGWKLSEAVGFTEKSVKDEVGYLPFPVNSTLELPGRSMVKLTYQKP